MILRAFGIPVGSRLAVIKYSYKLELHTFLPITGIKQISSNAKILSFKIIGKANRNCPSCRDSSRILQYTISGTKKTGDLCPVIN